MADYKSPDWVKEYIELLTNATKAVDGLAMAEKARIDALSKGAKVAEAKVKSINAEVKATSELEKIQKKRDVAINKNIALNRDAAKQLAKVTYENQQKTKAIKDEVVAEQKVNNAIKQGNAALKIQIKSKADAKRQTALLRGSVEQLDLTTKKGIATEKIYNAQIDKNTSFLKKNSDTQSKAKQSVGGYTAGINKSTLAVGSMGASLSLLPGVLGRVGFAMSTVGTAAKTLMANPIFLAIGAFALLVKGISSSLKTAKEFQSANSDLAVTLGVSRKETERLTDSAKELGKVTAFSAIEVLRLQNEYAKLGKSEDEIIALTTSTINLSTVTRKGADESATFIGGLLNQYGLVASEATRVADVTTAATQKSALDFDKLSTALPIVGKTAKNAGDSIETLFAKLGVLADNNIDASTSATALRNIYIDLNKWGLTYEEALEKINNSSNKTNTAFELFGKRGQTVAVTLAENSEKAKELAIQLNNVSGAAAKGASEKLNTLEGSVTLLKSAWEGLKLTVTDGEGIFIQAAKYVVDFGTGAITVMSKVIEVFGKTFNFFGENILAVLDNGGLRFRIWGEQIKQIIADIPILGKGIDVSESETNLKRFQEGVVINNKNAQQSWEDLRDSITGATVASDKVKTKTSSINRGSTSQTTSTTKEDNVILGFTQSDQDNAIERQISAAEQIASDLLALDQEVYEEELAEEEKYLEKIDKMRDDAAEKEKQRIEDEKFAVEELRALKLDIANELFNFTSILGDAKIAKLEQDTDSEGNINKKAADEIAKIKRRQALLDKAQSLFNIGIGTAEGVLNYGKNPITAPLIPFILALGAVQAASVIATPIPQFKDGVRNFGGGMAIVGDGGESEMVRNPDGSFFMTPDTPTATYLQSGADVLNQSQIKSEYGSDYSKLLAAHNRTNDLLDQQLSKKGPPPMTAAQYESANRKQSFRDKVALKSRGRE